MIHSQNPTRLLRECRISDQRRNQQSARRCERSYATPSLRRAIWQATRLPYAIAVDAVEHDRRPFHRAIPAVVARLWQIMGQVPPCCHSRSISHTRRLRFSRSAGMDARRTASLARASSGPGRRHEAMDKSIWRPAKDRPPVRVLAPQHCAIRYRDPAGVAGIVG
jgi:hypothetical protein